MRHADAFAERLQSEGGSRRSKIERGYQVLYARAPTPTEIRLGEAFLESEQPNVWSQYAQTLLISNEMFMVD